MTSLSAFFSNPLLCTNVCHRCRPFWAIFWAIWTGFRHDFATISPRISSNVGSLGKNLRAFGRSLDGTGAKAASAVPDVAPQGLGGGVGGQANGTNQVQRLVEGTHGQGGRREGPVPAKRGSGRPGTAGGARTSRPKGASFVPVFCSGVLFRCFVPVFCSCVLFLCVLPVCFVLVCSACLLCLCFLSVCSPMMCAC